MITEEDLAGLELAGMEPAQRFRAIEKIAARRLTERYSDDTYLYDDFDYMCSVLEAARHCGISNLAAWNMPPRESDWGETCRNFRAEATRVSQRILFETFSQPEKDPNTVALDAATKLEIRFHLNQVREIVDKEPIPDWKRENIHAAITALEVEIDKARTRLASIIDVIGKVFENPTKSELVQAVGKIISLVQDAKTAEKKKALLAAPTETKRIPPPSSENRPRLQSRNSFEKDLDNEIPF